MNIENEYASVNLGRSKSCDHLADLLNDEIGLPTDDLRKRFSRQGAFRRRTQDLDILIHKRNSMVECKKKLKTDLELFRTEFLMEKGSDGHKKIKNSFASFALVKGMWRSINKDNKAQEKEDTKKRSNEGRTISCNIVHSSCEIDSSDIKIFLRKVGKKVSETSDEQVMLTESTWEELVDNSNIMTKIEIDQQAAIWEIIETEAKFIKQLNIITHIFYPVLQKLLTTYPTELAGVDIYDIFGNIHELYLHHLTLWNNSISLPLSVSRIKRVPLDICLMKEGFCKVSRILGSYIDFMHSLPGMRQTIRNLQKRSPIFNEYIEWTQTYCLLCRDGHLCVLSLPFQRITRYKLLLERVRSLSSKEHHVDLDDMIHNLHSFVQQMNSAIVGKYSMKDIKQKIVEASIVKEHFFDTNKVINEDDLVFDVMRPLPGYKERLLIHEGRLKLRQGYNKMSDVQCYLCNDLFMTCKPIRNNWDKLKILKSPIRLDKILIKDEFESYFAIIVYNDFRVIEDAMVFIGSGDEIKLWVDKCNKAISEFVSQFHEPSHAAIMSVNYSYEVTMPIQEEDYSSDESQRVWKHSETASSGYSTYSTDSAFSQASSTSTQTDCCSCLSKMSLVKNVLLEDGLTIDEELCLICYNEPTNVSSEEPLT